VSHATFFFHVAAVFVSPVLFSPIRITSVKVRVADNARIVFVPAVFVLADVVPSVVPSIVPTPVR
jgi:hypothetical protein